jgi:hypothetical protein
MKCIYNDIKGLEYDIRVNYIKKQMNVERNKQIQNNYDDLVELYKNLLNHTEPNDLFDDVKHSYTHFVDKCIIYLSNKSNIVHDESSSVVIEDNRHDNEKMSQMLDLCHDVNYDTIILDEDCESSTNEIIVKKCNKLDEFTLEELNEDDYDHHLLKKCGGYDELDEDCESSTNEIIVTKCEGYDEYNNYENDYE